jgi:hypothetical protein
LIGSDAVTQMLSPTAEWAIDSLFPRLSITDKKFIATQLLQVLSDMAIRFGYARSRETLRDFARQIEMNDGRDAKCLILIIIPHIDDSKWDDLTNLHQLYTSNFTTIQWARCKRSGGKYQKDMPYSNEHIEHNTKLLCYSISRVANKLHPNWMDILPIPMAEYEKSQVYTDTAAIMREVAAIRNDKLACEPFIEQHVKGVARPGIPLADWYDVLLEELYERIKTVKWYIYDYSIGKMPITAIYLWDRVLALENVYTDKNWALLEPSQCQDFTNSWDEFYSAVVGNRRMAGERTERIGSRILRRMFRSFMVGIQNFIEKGAGARWKDSYRSFEILKNGKKPAEDDEDDDDEADENELTPLPEIFKSGGTVSAEAVYAYLLESMKKFRASWFGGLVFTGDKIVGPALDPSVRYNYLRDDEKKERKEEREAKQAKKEYYPLSFAKMQKTIQGAGVIGHDFRHVDAPFSLYLTLKNLYNWAKSLCHTTIEIEKSVWTELPRRWMELDGNESLMYRVESSGRIGSNKANTVKDARSDEIVLNFRQLVARRLLWVDVEWLVLNRYFRTTYNVSSSDPDIRKLSMNFNLWVGSNVAQFLPDLITQCLIRRGTLNVHQTNPQLTDWTRYSGPPEKRFQWIQEGSSKTVLTKARIDALTTANNFITEQPYEKKYLESLVQHHKMEWYTLFALNWIAQISIYHHYIHNRVAIITGATGIGKSTQIPKLYLYALKMIDGVADAYVACTQPRIEPTRSNSTGVAAAMGVPMEVENRGVGGTVETTNPFVKGTYKDSGATARVSPTGTLEFITDGTLFKKMLSSVMLKRLRKKRTDVRNLYDIIIVDETHEHNANMDMILTVARSMMAYNNSVRIVIMSATITLDDEKRYRSYFRDINDNIISPWCSTLWEKQLDRINVDRRVHISPPAGKTRYEIREQVVDIVGNKKPKDVINKLIERASELAIKAVSEEEGEVLVFMPGQMEIFNTCWMINSSSNIPADAIAIPFYSALPQRSRDLIQKIDVEKRQLKWSRADTVEWMYMEDLEKQRHLPEVMAGGWKRIIIVATNIAEASITISTLKTVIDTGIAKVSEFDALTRRSRLDMSFIAEFNRVQRKGRVGRTQPGKVIFLYNPDRVKYNKPKTDINQKDLSDMILGLLAIDRDAFTCMQQYGSLFTEGPHGWDIPRLQVDALRGYERLIQKQYAVFPMMKGGDGSNKYIQLRTWKGLPSHYDYENSQPPPSIDTISWPDTICDYYGRFYLIHPDETYLVRDQTGTITRFKIPEDSYSYGYTDVVSGVPTLAIQSANIVTSIGRLRELGLLRDIRLNEIERMPTSILKQVPGIKHDPNLVERSAVLFRLTSLGDRVYKVMLHIMDNVSRLREYLRLEDVLLLMWGNYYKCLPEVVSIYSAIWACKGSLVQWAPVTNFKDPKTGKWKRRFDTEGFFKKWAHPTSDHLALLSITNSISPLMHILYGQNSLTSATWKASASLERQLSEKWIHIKTAVPIVSKSSTKTGDITVDDFNQYQRLLELQSERGLSQVELEKDYVAKNRFRVRKLGMNKRLTISSDNHQYELHCSSLGLSSMAVYFYMMCNNDLIDTIRGMSELSLTELEKTEDRSLDFPIATSYASAIRGVPCEGLDERIVRCFLYSNPVNTIMYKQGQWRLHHDADVIEGVALDMRKSFSGDYETLCENPSGVLLFQNLTEVGKRKEDESSASEISGAETSGKKAADEPEKPKKDPYFYEASIITAIPEKWLVETNPHINYPPGPEWINYNGFNLAALSNRLEGGDDLVKRFIDGEL